MREPLRGLVFTVERDPDGGFVAACEDQCIITQADDLEALKAEIRDAVCCHFEDEVVCPPIRLRLGGEEIDL